MDIEALGISSDFEVVDFSSDNIIGSNSHSNAEEESNEERETDK